MSKEREFLTIEEAAGLLPDKEMVHIYGPAKGAHFLGSDITKEAAIELIKAADVIEKAGEQAARFNHKIVIGTKDGRIFIESKRDPQNPILESICQSCIHENACLYFKVPTMKKECQQYHGKCESCLFEGGKSDTLCYRELTFQDNGIDDDGCVYREIEPNYCSEWRKA